MKFVLSFAVLTCLGLVTAISLLILHTFGLIPEGWAATAVVSLLVLRYAVIPILFIALAGALAFSIFKIYQSLSDRERTAVHGVVLPAIDVGVNEARKRSDTWGKAAKWARRYQRMARKYPR